MSTSNLTKYKKELEQLVSQAASFLDGIELDHLLRMRQLPAAKATEHKKFKATFARDYQSWFSESGAVIRQLLPDRLEEFNHLYRDPLSSERFDHISYSIHHYLRGLTLGHGDGVDREADFAWSRLNTQLAILRAASRRFESSLFDIRQIVQADLFDSELEAARALLKHKFVRAAGAVAGVVLEKHVGQVCANHNVVLKVKNPTISTFNDALKAANVIDVPDWRRIQLLGDYRNRCDHPGPDPKPEDISDLIDGTEKITKTLF